MTVNGEVARKASASVPHDARIAIADAAQLRYVSRAGLKLEKALDAFQVDVTDLVCLDAGLSTGGFTDCLLQRGAKRVYGIDVGTAQVHEKLANDERVVVMEQTNLRTLESLLEPIDLVTLDLSFISVLKVLPNVVKLCAKKARMVVLIKPQFEAGKEALRRGGLVSDPEVHERVKQEVVAGAEKLGLRLVSEIIESPLKGAAQGNTEFLALFVKSN